MQHNREYFTPVLRIRDVYPGSKFFPSRIPIRHQRIYASKNLCRYFNPKKLFLSSRKYDPSCSSRIRILIFYQSRIPDQGVKKAPDPGSGSATLFYTVHSTRTGTSRTPYPSSHLVSRTQNLVPRTPYQVQYIGPRISHLVTRTSYHVFISNCPVSVNKNLQYETKMVLCPPVFISTAQLSLFPTPT
jgi:hypothetical protein